MLTELKSQNLCRFEDGETRDAPLLDSKEWTLEETRTGERLIIAVRKNEIDLLSRLVSALPEPIWLLYVLVVPRSDLQPGRYQCLDPMSREMILTFIAEYKDFLERDGRHNLWFRSVSTGDMIVYDRHELIYAYGNLDTFRNVLRDQNVLEVKAGSIRTLVPHSHYYHAVFDADAERLLTSREWNRTPLHEQDVV